MATQNLILGDNMEFIANVPDKYYDVLIADCAYGIGEDGLSNHSRGKRAKATLYMAKNWDNQSPPKQYFDECIRISKNQIFWGANHFISKLPYDSSCWIVWDKNNTGDFADCELAWTSFDTAVRKFKYTWNGMLQEDMKNKEKRIHPTQKPVALYKWILTNYAKKGMKIYDPNGGSMSSAIACYDIGFDLDIIENDPDYFRDGKERYDNHVLKCEEIKQLGYAKTAIQNIAPTLF